MVKSVFYDLYDDPKEAAILAAKSDLMLQIEKLIKESGLNNTKTAELLDVPRSRVSELMNGKIDKISLDSLTAWLSVLSKGTLKVSVVETTIIHSKEVAYETA
jgi:predicted XRE-type DNA-binding protein